MGLGNSRRLLRRWLQMDAGPSLTTMRGLVRNNSILVIAVNFAGGTAFDGSMALLLHLAGTELTFEYIC